MTMPEGNWLADYRQRLKNKQSLIFSPCPCVPVSLYINIYNDIYKIRERNPGTPAMLGCVPRVPMGHEGHGTLEDVSQEISNYIKGQTQGTRRTPPGDRVQLSFASEALPEPTLRVLACLQEHFMAKGYQAWEADTLALATLGELMSRKGGPVAMAEEVEAADDLSKAIRLVKEVFGLEVEREGV